MAAARLDDINIAAGVATQQVITGAAIEGIVAGPAIERVVTAGAAQQVVAGTDGELIIASVAGGPAGRAGERQMFGIGGQDIVYGGHHGIDAGTGAGHVLIIDP